MRRQRLFLILVLWCGQVQAETIGNIWCVGDSITKGSVPGGYRLRLLGNLMNAADDFALVGTNDENSTPYLTSSGNPYHDGWGGYTIIDVQWRHHEWLAAIPKPDVVLILLGTNDFGPTRTPEWEQAAIGRLDTLVGDLAGHLPQARILASNLIVRADAEEANIAALFNPFVPAVAQKHGAQFVDLHSVLTLADLADGVHPTQEGYDKLGEAWYGAILVPEPSAAVALVGLAILAGLAMLRSTTSRPKVPVGPV